MVDNIVEAAARVLADKGWARFTTNEVAQLAGVSVGSLYQYFPNKLALAEAIRQRHLAAVLAALSWGGHEDNEDKAVTTSQQAALLTEGLINGIIAAHTINPALHRVLLDEVPPAQRLDDDAFEKEYQGRYLAFIKAVCGKEKQDNARFAARVLSAAVEGVVHMAARRGQLASPALRKELQCVVLGYVCRRSSS